MALLLLIIIGISAGWLSSIIARTEQPSEILRQIGIATAAALIVGVVANGNSVLGGLTPLALLLSVLAAGAAMLAYHMIVRDKIRT
ncbi:MAG: hypothetical protein WA936_06780 [Erythrobacter sp.]|uniref:hypothetical protein n=1 Tax=Erythrobacter sp. TaxID=1042 RepID=UPI003C720B09